MEKIFLQRKKILTFELINKTQRSFLFIQSNRERACVTKLVKKIYLVSLSTENIKTKEKKKERTSLI
jgi:hypothetical protein